jgi:hypothetical protein
MAAAFVMPAGTHSGQGLPLIYNVYLKDVPCARRTPVIAKSPCSAATASDNIAMP